MEHREKVRNGWTNQETWVTARWLDNDRARYSYWRKVARKCLKSAPSAGAVTAGYWSVEDMACCELSEQIQQEVTYGLPVAESSLIADLLRAALHEVNWEEIANHYLADE